jgi:hypothetical protein
MTLGQLFESTRKTVWSKRGDNVSKRSAAPDDVSPRTKIVPVKEPAK